MKILRVVNGNGKGMYCFCTKMKGTLWSKSTDGADHPILHPIPDADMSVEISRMVKERGDDSVRFGFLDKRQFLRWVYDPDWRARMTELGGVLRVYDVNPEFVIESNEQVVFPKQEARLLEELPVDVFDVAK